MLVNYKFFLNVAAFSFFIISKPVLSMDEYYYDLTTTQDISKTDSDTACETCGKTNEWGVTNGRPATIYGPLKNVGDCDITLQCRDAKNKVIGTTLKLAEKKSVQGGFSCNKNASKITWACSKSETVHQDCKLEYTSYVVSKGSDSFESNLDGEEYIYYDEEDTCYDIGKQDDNGEFNRVCCLGTVLGLS